MGIDLNNQYGSERFGFRTWADLQLLALLNGWEPEGTYIDYEDPPQWMGYFYNSNSGQTVRTGDAANMAAALTRALDHLVDRPEHVICLDLSPLVGRRSWTTSVRPNLAVCRPSRPSLVLR